MSEEKSPYEEAGIVEEAPLAPEPASAELNTEECENPKQDPSQVLAPKALVPIDGVTFTSAGKRFVMRPAQDVTAYESMLLSQMVFCFLLSSNTPWDVRNYISLHNLERHFMVSM